MSKSRNRRQSRNLQLEALTKEVVELRAKLAQTAAAPKQQKLPRRPRLEFADVVFTPPEVKEAPSLVRAPVYETASTAKLSKSVDAFRLNEDPAARLAFEVDPNDAVAQAVYVPKTRGVSDQVLRRIGIQESLVACILHARGHQMAAHGNPRRDRFSFGYTIQLTPAAQAKLSTQEKKDLQPEIQRAITVMATCGREDVPRRGRCTLGRWLYESTRDGLLLGRFATEIVFQPDAVTGHPKFDYFRPIDAATIYRVAPQGTDAARQVRVQSKQLLQRITDEALPDENFLERFFEDEFAWVQVINGQPMQVFTEDQCLVHAFYPVTDVEAQGYPLTPIDTAISEVTTRLAITTHNRLYFQSGRAAKGALVITSEDVDDAILQDMRQKFSASINGVNSAHRMPVFALAPGETVQWVAMDGPKDMEFQYLSDQNARTLLSVFQMSPEELPGYSHLSRGTATQALAESNQEYLLEAHRDLGIRPLIEHFQGFLTSEILPLIAPSLVEHCEVRLLGLGAESAEKESVRIQQDLPVHLTFNEVMGRVEKEPVPRAVAGDLPLNPQWGAVCDKMVPLNEQQAVFLAKDEDDAKRYRDSLGTRYLRDPFWWQMRQDLWQQFQMLTTQALPLAQFALPAVIRELFPSVPEKELPQVAQQLVMQAEQMMQQQAAQAGTGGDPGGGDGGGGGGPQPQQDSGQPQQGDPQAQEQQDGGLGQDLQQAQDALGKSERQLGRPERRALEMHKRAVASTLSNFRREARMATMQILGEVNKRRTGGAN